MDINENTENVDNTSSDDLFMGLDPKTLDLFGAGEGTEGTSNETDIANEDNSGDTSELQDADNIGNEEDNVNEPDKFKGKSREDIIQSYQNLESLHGKVSSRKTDLDVYDTLMSKVKDTKSGMKAAQLLNAVLTDDYSSLQGVLNDQSGDGQVDDSLPEDYEYMSDTEKAMYSRMKQMEKSLEEISGKLSKSDPAMEHANVQYKQRQVIEEASNVANTVGNRHNIKIDVQKMIAFGRENAEKYKFSGWNDVAYEYVMLQKQEFGAKQRETQDSRRASAPKITPGNSQKANAPTNTYNKWTDLESSIRAQLNK